MRVCFFIPRLWNGGAEKQCASIINELQQFPGVEAHLILLAPGEFDSQLDTSNLKVHRTHVRDFASPLALAFLIRTLWKIRPHILLSWMQAADIWAYAATRVVPGIKWIIAERSSVYPEEMAYRIRRIVGRRGAAGIIANSEAGRKYWEDATGPSAPVYVIPNLLTAEQARGAADIDRITASECLFVGRLEPEKNIALMVKSFALFAGARPTARLLLSGRGTRADEAQRLAAEGGASDKVQFLGFRNDVPDLMSRARLLLSFSLFEGMPNALLEAVSQGLPAVVSDIPSHRALLGDDYPFYIGLEATPDEARAVMEHAWADGPASVGRLYRNAKSKLAEMAPDKVVEAYVGAFQEILDRPRH